MANVYGVKDEYLDMWGADTDSIITEDALADIARGWDKDPDDVIEQLYEIPVILEGYNPENDFIAIILDDNGELWETDAAWTTKYRRVNEERYDHAFDFRAVELALTNDGYRDLKLLY